MSATLSRTTRPVGAEAGSPERVAVVEGGGRWWHVVVVAGIALILAVVVLRPFPLSDPVLYRGDAFQHEILTGAADGWGSPAPSADLAAPDSVDWSVFPTGTERLQLFVLHALRVASGGVIAAVNLYLLVGVVVTAVVAFAVLRWMGLRPLLAGAAAVVFTFAPAFSSAVFEGHLFLFALYPVALAVWLALWSTMADGRPRPPRSELALATTAVVATGLSSAYYTAFAVVVILAVGSAVAARRRSVRSLLRPGAVVLGLVAVAGASLLPNLLARRGDPAAGALRRTAADVWRYSLRPQDLLVLGDDHPLGPLARGLRELGSSAVRPGTGTVLGLFALVGCVGCLIVAFRHNRAPRDRSDRIVGRLAVVVVAVMAVATVGGLGTWLGELGFTQVRAWSRMVVVLSFVGLSAGGLLLQRQLSTRSWSAPRVAIGVVVIAALALLDQGFPALDPAAAARQAGSDAEVVSTIETQVGASARVFELPVVSFPDDPGSGRLLAPAVHSDGRLRFSAGFFRGGESDWQLSWCRQPAGAFVRAVAVAGYDALLVQRNHHLVSDPGALQAQLDAQLGAPTGTSRDGAFVWYDLRPLRAELIDRFGERAVARSGDLVRRPIGVDYVGVTDLRLSGRAMAGGGAVRLRRLDGDGGPVEVTMHVQPDGGEGRTVRSESDLDEVVTEIPVPGPAPTTVSGLSVIDVRALDDPVLGPRDGDALVAVCM